MKKNSELHNPNKSELQPYKSAEYKLFILWKTLPKFALIKTNSDSCFKIIDELGLSEIMTQNDFALAFNVHPSTLSEWSNSPEPTDSSMKIEFDWVKELTKEVIYILFMGLVEFKDAARVKLWLELVDPSQKHANNRDMGPNTLLELINAANELDI